MISRSDRVAVTWNVDRPELVAIDLGSEARLELEAGHLAVLELVHRLRAPSLESILGAESAIPTDCMRLEGALKELLSFGVLADTSEPASVDAFYSPLLYARMLTDGFKMEAFKEAVGSSVSSGMRVLHAGCGLGVFSIWAARAGAEVVAVDNRPIVHLAERMAVLNQVEDRIAFVRGDVFSETIAAQIGKFDLVVSEFIGDEIFDEDILLKSQRVSELYRPLAVIPKSVSGIAIAVECDEAWCRIEGRCADVTRSGEKLGVAVEPVAEMVKRVGLGNDIAERLYVSAFKEISSPDLKRLSGEIEFHNSDLLDVSETLFANDSDFTLTTAGSIDCLVVYFRAQLSQTSVLTSDPWLPGRTHWPQVVHLTAERIPAEAGESFKAGFAYLGGKGLEIGVWTDER